VYFNIDGDILELKLELVLEERSQQDLLVSLILCEGVGVGEEFMGGHDEEGVFCEGGQIFRVPLNFFAVGVLAVELQKLFQFEGESLLEVDLFHTYGN